MRGYANSLLRPSSTWKPDACNHVRPRHPQVPTFRATPLHPECDTYCDFPVADRANAVMQWWVCC